MNFTSIVIGTSLLKHKFNFEIDASGVIIMAPYTVTVVLMPILGKVADKVGNRMYLVFLCGAINTVSHLYGLMQQKCDRCAWSIVPFFLYGLQLTIYNVVMWGMIPYIVEADKVGTAYGIVVSC